VSSCSVIGENLSKKLDSNIQNGYHIFVNFVKDCDGDLSMSTIRKVKKLTREDFIKKVMSGSLSTDRAITQLTEQLHQYEKKYNMRSEVFYKLIVGTPAEDHPDFLSWAMCYRSHFRVLKTKFSIEEVPPSVH
jgi:hypothetical protein